MYAYSAEQALAVRACLLQVARQRWQAAQDEPEWQLPALQRNDRRDQEGERVLAVAVALIVDQLRLVQQHDLPKAPVITAPL